MSGKTMENPMTPDYAWFRQIENRNLLVLDDNLVALKNIPPESIDLIYLDPPFNSGRDYNVIWGDKGEVRSFGDRWGGGSPKTGLQIYIEWMAERVWEMHRVLKPTGSFYLHCDWHASHYLKVMCDDIFGYGNFLNEIVWQYDGPQAPSPLKFASKHDKILRYAKDSKRCVANDLYYEERIPREEATFKQDEQGRYFYDLPKGDYTEESIARLEQEGRIRRTKTGTVRIKYFVEQARDGAFIRRKKMPDVWTDITSLGLAAQSKEAVGYPTQKPLALLERIIKASSNPGDIVLDPFCGGGTTLVAADKLGRRYIGFDSSVAAIRVSDERLQEFHGMFEDKYPLILGFPHDFDILNNLDPHDFAAFVIRELGGTPNEKKTGDKGIDGRKGEHPIQVKQSTNVGRNVVDNFLAAIQRAKKTEGTIIAFSFTTGAKNEAARLKNEDGISIELLEAGKIVPINRRPTVEIKVQDDDGENVVVVAGAHDQEKDDIVLWNWFVDGKPFEMDIVCQRKGKDSAEPCTTSRIAFKYKNPVKVKVIATDSFGGKGESIKTVGRSDAYRSASVERVK